MRCREPSAGRLRSEHRGVTDWLYREDVAPGRTPAQIQPRVQQLSAVSSRISIESWSKGGA